MSSSKKSVPPPQQFTEENFVLTQPKKPRRKPTHKDERNLDLVFLGALAAYIGAQYDRTKDPLDEEFHPSHEYYLSRIQRAFPQLLGVVEGGYGTEQTEVDPYTESMTAVRDVLAKHKPTQSLMRCLHRAAIGSPTVLSDAITIDYIRRGIDVISAKMIQALETIVNAYRARESGESDGLTFNAKKEIICPKQPEPSKAIVKVVLHTPVPGIKKSASSQSKAPPKARSGRGEPPKHKKDKLGGMK